MKTSIAVIGGGVAGLTAAYLLQEKYHIPLDEIPLTVEQAYSIFTRKLA